MLPLTPFIGREQEAADIQALLAQQSCRLLTLVGPGGTGKTRLAWQVAKQQEELFADGTAVIPLQPLRSNDFFLPALAEGLGLSLAGQEAPLTQIGRFLQEKELLIVLDNFEHLLEASEHLLALLPIATHVKFIVTSREALNLQEEWVYPLTGLTFPAAMGDETAVQSYDAVQLFNERASRANPNFSTVAEADAIIRICQLVDGMPLAIELAAAWRRSLDCQTIAAEIERDLEFLTTRFRNVPARHRSIQAIFDQTWAQLTVAEQAVFKRLSVFQGEFARKAAQAVAGASLATLSLLVDKSLLRVADNGRYQIHELLRQYAAEHLAQNEAEAVQCQTDHAIYYLEFLYHLRGNIRGHRQLEVIQAIKNELTNVRVAWLQAVAQADAPALEKACDTLGYFYQYTGNYVEGLQLTSQATAVLQAQPSSDEVSIALLRTLLYDGYFYLRFGRLAETEASMALSQELYHQLDIPPLPPCLSDPQTLLGFVALTRGNYKKAVALAQAARQTAVSPPHPVNDHYACYVLAEAFIGQGEYEQAQQAAQEGYALSQETGDQWFSAYLLNDLGQIALALDDLATAKQHFQMSYEIRQAFNDPEGMALASNRLGNIALQTQALAEATQRFETSYAIYRRINDAGGLAAAGRGLGQVAIAQDDYASAQAHWHEALKLSVAINFRPLLCALLVDVALLWWQVGRRKRPLTLLNIAARHPAADHETKSRATHQLDLYHLGVPRDQFATAQQEAEIADLKQICQDVLAALKLPLEPMEAETAVSPTKPTAQPLLDPLTPRELDVLKLLANGRSNPEIAEELILSVGTIKFYTNKIFSKLAVRNRVEAVTRAQELDLLQ